MMTSTSLHRCHRCLPPNPPPLAAPPKPLTHPPFAPAHSEDDNDEHHCSSGLQDEDETGIDCGGASCDACVVAHCADYIQNEDETGTDCGGADCG